MRIDQVKSTFRAPLAANYTGAATAVGVGINSSGQVTVGAGVAAVGIVGVILEQSDKLAGDIVDVFIDAEIVEAGLAAGTAYTANTTTGVISNGAASATQKRIGFTLEADRLVVNVRDIDTDT